MAKREIPGRSDAPAPEQMPAGLRALTPWAIFQAALRAVPALKYALAVLGIVSALAIIKGFGIDFRVAIFGTVVMVVMMVALVVFAALTKVRSAQVRHAALVMMWSFLTLTLLTALLLFTSAFFGYPKPLEELFGPNPQPPEKKHSGQLADSEESESIPPLKSPVVEVPTSTSNTKAPAAAEREPVEGGPVKIAENAARQGAKEPLPEPLKDGLLVRRILKGAAPSPADKVFDIVISNNSTHQLILKTFDLRWTYYHGFLSSVDRGEVLKPVAKYVLDLPIDTDDRFPELANVRDIDRSSFLHQKSVPIYPTLVLPPRNESGPSVTTIRLQLHYHFGGRIDWHPCSDWNIWYGLAIVDESGGILEVFKVRSWRGGNEDAL